MTCVHRFVNRTSWSHPDCEMLEREECEKCGEIKRAEHEAQRAVQHSPSTSVRGTGVEE
jgi:hypothetical protein